MTPSNTTDDIDRDRRHDLAKEALEIVRYFAGQRFAQFGLLCLLGAAALGEIYLNTTFQAPYRTLVLGVNMALGLTGMAAMFTAYETTVQRFFPE